ncbi:MAG: RluA family pseudouridine synthase [Mariprofundaceae bacterium]|nr:RluA family pseudouridine synthase [Mariprofundaceae bacterium]
MASTGNQSACITVDHDEDGSRLDRLLLRRLGGQKRTLMMRLIRRGNVRVNRKRARPDTRLQQGDVIYLPASLREGDREADGQKRDGSTIPLHGLEVLFEDDEVLVVNKPAGMVVHGGSGHASGLIEALKAARQLPDLRLAHRLDRDTSGCLLLAKRLPVLRALARQFHERQAHKTYFAWVAGHPYPCAGRLFSRLGKGVVLGGERMVVDQQDGKEAVTDYQVILLASHGDWPFALLALQPESGRTHQLRVQLQSTGHAILGDPKYAGRDDTRHFRDIGGRGLALHAWRLRFRHPVSGEMLDIRAPWPVRWQCLADVRKLLCPDIISRRLGKTERPAGSE